MVDYTDGAFDRKRKWRRVPLAEELDHEPSVKMCSG